LDSFNLQREFVGNVVMPDTRAVFQDTALFSDALMWVTCRWHVNSPTQNNSPTSRALVVRSADDRLWPRSSTSTACDHIYYYKDHKWVQECRWRQPSAGIHMPWVTYLRRPANSGWLQGVVMGIRWRVSASAATYRTAEHWTLVWLKHTTWIPASVYTHDQPGTHIPAACTRVLVVLY